jgi:hypothetical protein
VKVFSPNNRWYRLVAGWNDAIYKETGSQKLSPRHRDDSWELEVFRSEDTGFASTPLIMQEQMLASGDTRRYGGLRLADLAEVDVHGNLFFDMSWQEASSPINHFVLTKTSAIGGFDGLFPKMSLVVRRFHSSVLVVQGNP